MRRICAVLAALMLLAAAASAQITVDGSLYPVREDGWYGGMEEVAVYVSTYDKLPENYITKREAQALGWEARLGNLWEVAEGRSIGGDRFGNYEGILPEKDGRTWMECDIDYGGGYRGAQRLMVSSDGLIYYTEDHYETFEEVLVIPAQEAQLEENWLPAAVLNWLWGG